MFYVNLNGKVYIIIIFEYSISSSSNNKVLTISDETYNN